MAFQFYIDGLLTDQPDNDKSLTTTVRRDGPYNAIVVTQDVSLTYSGNNNLEPNTISGYAYLKALSEQGSCNEATILITDQVDPVTTYEIYRGVIKVPSIQIEEQLIRLTTKIQDNSFYSYIDNNRNIRFNPRSTKTKSGQNIEAPPIYNVNMFNPFGGVYGDAFGLLFRGYRVYDLFRFVIAAMSDNKVGFESDYLQQSSVFDDKELFLFTGQSLAEPNTDPAITVSFDELITEIFKAKNVTFYIDMRIPSAPVLRLEDSAFFYQESQVLSFDDIKNLTTTYKTTKLLGTVNIGSNFLRQGQNPPYPFHEDISYFGFKEETYTPLGQCNTAGTLNLVNDYVISCNAIVDQLAGVVDQNFEKTFMIECENIDDVLFEALASRYLSYTNVNQYFYNLGLINSKRLGIHGNNFQTAVTNTQEIGGDGFRASLQSELLLITNQTGLPQSTVGFGIAVTTDPVVFPDELTGNNYDGNGNYAPVFGYYEAPSDGNYSFTANLRLLVENLKSCNNVTVQVISSNTGVLGFYAGVTLNYGFMYKVFIDVYEDNTLANLLSSASQTRFTLLNGIQSWAVAYPVQLATGNTVQVRFEGYFQRFIPSLFTTPADSNFGIVLGTTNCFYSASEPKASIFALEDSYFECNGTPSGGISLTANDPDGYKILQHSFIDDITVEDFQQVLANPIGLFPFEKDGITRNGWIDELQHENFTGRTQIKLITSDATIS